MLPTLDARPAGAPVPLAALFGAFLKVSLMAFGGGLVWARRTVVDKHRWLSDEEFADLLSLCQFLPGPNIVGVATCVGAKLRGGVGALAAIAGFILVPGAIGFTLGAIYLEHTGIPILQQILKGVAAAAAGLLIATGLRLLYPHRARPVTLLFAALAFIGMAFTGLPLLAVLFVLAPLSIAAAAVEGARRR